MTAHHFNDQIETFFLRMLRGSALKGLSSMNPSTIINNRTISESFIHQRHSLAIKQNKQPFLTHSKLVKIKFPVLTAEVSNTKQVIANGYNFNGLKFKASMIRRTSIIFTVKCIK